MAQHHETQPSQPDMAAGAGTPAPAPFPDEALARLRSGTHHDPHSVFGAHRDGSGSVIRTMQPGAVAVEILVDGRTVPMSPLGHGMFGASLPDADLPDYQIGRAHV